MNRITAVSHCRVLVTDRKSIDSRLYAQWCRVSCLATIAKLSVGTYGARPTYPVWRCWWAGRRQNPETRWTVALSAAGRYVSVYTSSAHSFTLPPVSSFSCLTRRGHYLGLGLRLKLKNDRRWKMSVRSHRLRANAQAVFGFWQSQLCTGSLEWRPLSRVVPSTRHEKQQSFSEYRFVLSSGQTPFNCVCFPADQRETYLWAIIKT